MRKKLCNVESQFTKMPTLCTFSGEFGDILWSMATVNRISQIIGEKVDMAIMPQYASLIQLLKGQPYINKAFAIENWIKTGSPHGAQPWCPPQQDGYDSVFHLTYKAHPGIGAERLPLIDFIAHQQGMQLVKPIPFLNGRNTVKEGIPYIAYAFNEQYAVEKAAFLLTLQALTNVVMLDVSSWAWYEAATLIKNAIAFVGCRSSNFVLACGVGQPNIFTYEPHPSRNASGQFGDVFGCPYVSEVSLDSSVSPEVCAAKCAEQLKTWMQPKEVYAAVES